MTKTFIIGAAVILLGWAGWAMFAPRDADSDAIMQQDNSMMVPAGDTMVNPVDEMMVATGTDAMMQDEGAVQ
ncbi:MAG: hypothetical protein NUV60_01605 [Patescibacteria group bacterium]|nr:hypothetical protein [Patescibacteria group bacterium]